jgi:hypothetical protein
MLVRGEGGEGNNYAFRGKRKRFGKLLGTSCEEILRKRPSNFNWNCNFSLLFSLLTHFAFIFFAVWSVSLDCEQSEKSYFFSLQSENENPHIFACFHFKRI